MIGYHLIRSVLENGVESFHTIVDSGISEDIFISQQEKDLFKLTFDHVKSYSVLPTEQLIYHNLNIELPNRNEEPPAFWVDQVKEYYVRFTLGRLSKSLEKSVGNSLNKEEIEKLFSEMRYTYDILENRKLSWTFNESLENVQKDYEKAHDETCEISVSTGLEELDNITGGIYYGDSWVITAETGAGKSYLMIKFALSAILEGKKVLFFPMEMTATQMARRGAVLGSEINPTHLLRGNMPQQDIQKMNNFIQEMKESGKGDLMLFREGTTQMSTDLIHSKIQDFQPDIVIIDGAYMLLPTGKKQFYKSAWERNQEVMIDLRQIALTHNIPIVSSYQYDQKAPKGNDSRKLKSIMGGQAIGQYSSVALLLDYDSDRPDSVYEESTSRIIKILKGREGESGKIRINFDIINGRITSEETIEGNQSVVMNDPFADFGEDNE